MCMCCLRAYFVGTENISYHLSLICLSHACAMLFACVSVCNGISFCSIQLAVDASIPEPLGGVGGETVYIGMHHDLMSHVIHWLLVSGNKPT